MSRTSQDYLEDILNGIEAIQTFIKGYTFETFEADQKTIFAVSRAIEIIGEASKQISPDIKQQYLDIPWREIAGMRDKMIHHYFSVNLKILWNTATNDLPPLKPKIQITLLNLNSDSKSMD